MYLVLNNIESGALLARKITEKVNRAEYSVTHAVNIFVAVEKIINIYIQNNFHHDLDGVEDLLHEALATNKADTIKAIKKSYSVHGDLVKIMLEETECSSLSKFLINPFEKTRAVELTRRRELSINQMVSDSIYY
jgi:hypothetical protein